MARHPKCTKCGAILDPLFRVATSICRSCFEFESDSRQFLRWKKHQLVQSGVHPRIADRICNVEHAKQISLGALRPLMLLAAWSSGRVVFRPKTLLDYNELSALGAGRMLQFQKSLTDTLKRFLYKPNTLHTREQIENAMSTVTRSFGFHMKLDWTSIDRVLEPRCE